ncbi:hypothetical protein [Rhodanobacter sp. A1T4]|uniref:XAC0095 family protein n=1 Tax=Rhodanobacter sp. A1T4 TaxID=2723087 RepID=UPI00161F8336|nr:hypothetical protein [Rhodanobacter sp. A1T4]MBB6245691.1 hypothetical protein [Rhodanobacter sp. A1T4]
MSTFDSYDRETMGYFLPENSQLRLQKLHEYAEFLSHIAQPRTPDVQQEWIPEINVEQVAICLELLAEQVGLVLDDLSFPAYRSESDAAPAASATPEAAEAMPSDAAGRYLFGMTLEQVDTLNQLIDMIVAHGDVVTASHDAELADHTLSLLGHAIFSDARAVREIIRQVESQRLNPPRSSHTGVSEEQGVYRVARKRARVHWVKNASTGQIH